MKFLSIYKTVERGVPPTQGEMAAMGKLIEDYTKAGSLRLAHVQFHPATCLFASGFIATLLKRSDSFTGRFFIQSNAP